MEENQSKNLTILIAILVIDLISFTCILPLFPSILSYYAQNSNKSLYGINATNTDYAYEYFLTGVTQIQNLIGIPNIDQYNIVFLGGILGSLFSLLQYLSSSFFGALSDVCGRKPILILSVLGSLLSYYLWSIANSFDIFIWFRIIGGLSKCSVSVAITIVTDIYSINKRGFGMAFVGIAFSIAFMMGPLVGAYFATKWKTNNQYENFNSAPAIFAIFLTVIELILVIVALPETLKIKKAKLSNLLSSFQNYVFPWRLLSYDAFYKPIQSEKNEIIENRKKSLYQYQKYGLTLFIYMFLYSSLEFTLCFLTHIRFNYNRIQQGQLFLFSGIVMIIVQGCYVRKISVEKQKKAILFGFYTIIPAYLIIGFTLSQLFLYIGLALYAIASSIVIPLLTSLVSNLSEESNKGTCMGIFRSIGALARAFGPIFGSFLFWLLGPTLCYTCGAILLFIPIILINSIKDEKILVENSHSIKNLKSQ